MYNFLTLALLMTNISFNHCSPHVIPLGTLPILALFAEFYHNPQ